MSNKLKLILYRLIVSAGESIEEIQQALTDLCNGKFVLVYDDDGREAETDFFIAAKHIKPQSIRTMRQDGGGLIFQMIAHNIGQTFNLPFLADLFSDNEERYPSLRYLVANDIPYDTKSSFSLYINHRQTFTGITDNDRATTMKGFADLAISTKQMSKDNALEQLGASFRTPGHVPICVASEKPLTNRFGHTELAVALLTMSGSSPVAGGCEMMGDNGKALSKSQAKTYAKQHDLVFLEGKDIIKSWRIWSE